MQVSVRTDATRLRAQYRDVRESQIPFATSVAINRTLEDGRQAITNAISSAFNSPTSWALRGVRYTKSDKKTLRGRIFLDDFAGKGIPAAKFLAAEVYGGERRHKRSEVLLRNKGLLPEGYFVVPGEACPLDSNGNIPGSVVVQVLSQVQAFGEQGFTANRKKGSRGARKLQKAGIGYFVGRPGNGLPLGIWVRRQFAHGSAIKPFMIFVRAPRYERRLNFFDIWAEVSRTRFPVHMREALNYAMSTARR